MQATGCVYLSFLGGGCTLLSQAVEEVKEVGWSDLLVHYRLVRLRVQALGPATVGIDATGRSLYDEQSDSARRRMGDILSHLDSLRQG
jgi:fumarate hydratase subunit beta